jgi:hypothetical protein
MIQQKIIIQMEHTAPHRIPKKLEQRCKELHIIVIIQCQLAQSPDFNVLDDNSVVDAITLAVNYHNHRYNRRTISM